MPPEPEPGAMTGGKRPGGKPPWQKESEPDAASFGKWLRRQREMREISLRDIAERTKISLRYLEAMEEDRFDLLPANIFAKGFLREYARYVGLSPDEVVNHYLSVHQPEAEDPGDKTLAGAARSTPSWTGLMLALAALALLALIAGLAWLAERRTDDDRTARPPAASSVPVEPVAVAALPPEPPAAEPAPPSPLELILDFNGECWVKVTVDGEPRINETRVQGESLEVRAEERIDLVLGNAQVVEAHLNGQPFPMARQGDQRRAEIAIDLETVRTLPGQREAR